MLKNAFLYVTRKKTKTLILLLVMIIMATLSLISISIKKATDESSKDTFKNITNSFSMQINRRVNQGTNRGAGNLKGEDIKKIAEMSDISGYVKRINAVRRFDSEKKQ